MIENGWIMLNLIEKYNKLTSQKELIEMANESIKDIEYLLEIVERNNLKNEQWFLDYLDILNEISVKW